MYIYIKDYYMLKFILAMRFILQTPPPPLNSPLPRPQFSYPLYIHSFLPSLPLRPSSFSLLTY